MKDGLWKMWASDGLKLISIVCSSGTYIESIYVSSVFFCYCQTSIQAPFLTKALWWGKLALLSDPGVPFEALFTSFCDQDGIHFRCWEPTCVFLKRKKCSAGVFMLWSREAKFLWEPLKTPWSSSASPGSPCVNYRKSCRFDWMSRSKT